VTIASPDADGRLPIGFASLPEDALVDAARRLGRAIDALDPGARRPPQSPASAGGSSIVRRLFRASPASATSPAGPVLNPGGLARAGSIRSAGPSSGVEDRRPSRDVEHRGRSGRPSGMRLCGLRSCLVPAMAAMLLGLAACTAPAASTSSSPAPSAGASPSAGNVTGVATAGPVCPVERPGDSACAARPVGGAVIVVTRPDGTEVARLTTAADGRFSLDLAPGDYILVPQPVNGMMGTAPSVPFTVGPTGQPGPSPTPLQVGYDTGIR
jgi:hypothetical protein